MEEGKGGKERGRKGGEGSWGGIGYCAVLKIPLKSRGARPTRPIVAPVQDLVCAIWALFHEYF